MKETALWLKLDKNESDVLMPPINSSINILMVSSCLITFYFVKVMGLDILELIWSQTPFRRGKEGLVASSLSWASYCSWSCLLGFSKLEMC